MANPWFRLYSEFSDDPKVQMMPEEMQRRLIMLFCERCKEVKHDETLRAFHWRVTPLEVSVTRELFLKNGFIDEDWNLLNWNRRQYVSDSSTDRVRKYRERLKTGEVTEDKGFIYYAICGERLKIGYSENPRVRLEALKLEFPGVRLISAHPGSKKEEKALHMKWGYLWIEGEWFSFNEELKYYLDSTKETEGNVSFENVTPPEQIQNRTESEQKHKKQAASAFVLPEWIDSKVWEAYEEMRRKIRKPMTDNARELAVKKLVKLEASGHQVEEVLNQSILQSWTGIFAVRQDYNGGNTNGHAKPTIDASVAARQALLDRRREGRMAANGDTGGGIIEAGSAGVERPGTGSANGTLFRTA